MAEIKLGFERLGKVLESAKASTTRVEKQIADADEMNAFAGLGSQV